MIVDIWGMGLQVEIEENKIEPYDLKDYDYIEHYEESYALDDGRIIAFNEGLNAWIMLG